MDNRVTVQSGSAKPVRSKSPRTTSAARAQQPQPLTDERVRTIGQQSFPPSSSAPEQGGLSAAEIARQKREDRAEERRSDRYANRRLLWKISKEKSVQCCGRGAVDSGAGVTIRSKGKRAYVSGVTRCSKIWLDPVCSAKIRASRAEEVSAALVHHIQSGGTAYMVTLTLQHHRRHDLEPLLEGLKDAWKALLSGSQWAGDPKRGREGERARMGVLGFVRSIEATFGETHGWHPHLHVVLFLGARQAPRPSIPKKEIKDPVTGKKIPNPARPEGWVKPTWDPTPVEYFSVPDPSWDRSEMTPEAAATAANFERMQARWARSWERWTEKHGFRAGSKHAIQWDRIASVEDAEALGQYVAKVQDGKEHEEGRRWHVGQEIARGDLKTGRQMGATDGRRPNETPFELLTRYRKLQSMTADQMEGLAKIGVDVGKELAKIRGIWHEWERDTKGSRAMEWSRYLRPALGLSEEEPTNEEIVAEEEHGEERAHLSAPAWARVCRLGMDYRVLRAVETGGVAELVVLLAEIGLSADSTDDWIDQEQAQLPNRGRRPEVEVIRE